MCEWRFKSRKHTLPSNCSIWREARMCGTFSTARTKLKIVRRAGNIQCEEGCLFQRQTRGCVVYIYLLPFRRLDKVGETVGKLCPYLRSQFVQLKSEVTRRAWPKDPSISKLEETSCRCLITSLVFFFVVPIIFVCAETRHGKNSRQFCSNSTLFD